MAILSNRSKGEPKCGWPLQMSFLCIMITEVRRIANDPEAREQNKEPSSWTVPRLEKSSTEGDVVTPPHITIKNKKCHETETCLRILKCQPGAPQLYGQQERHHSAPRHRLINLHADDKANIPVSTQMLTSLFPELEAGSQEVCSLGR